MLRHWGNLPHDRWPRMEKVVGTTQPVARGFIPAGLRSSPKKSRYNIQPHCLNPRQNHLTLAPLPGSSLNASTLTNTITAPTTTITDGRSASTKEAINIAVGGIR